MNVTETCFDHAFFRFGLDYPRSFPTLETVKGLRMLWREMLHDHPWIDDALFTAAVKTAGYTVAGYLPERATFLELCREENRKRHERGRQDREAWKRPALTVTADDLTATFKAAQGTAHEAGR